MSQQLNQQEQELLQTPDLAVTADRQATAAVVTPAPQDRVECEEIDEWLAYVARPRSRTWIPLTAVTALYLQSAYYVLQGGSAYWSQIGLFRTIQMLGFSLVVPTVWISYLVKVDRLAETADDAMLGPPSPRWIGPLIDALDAPNRRVRAAASRQLTRLLTRIKPEDAAYLSPVHRRILYGVLRRNAARDSELVAAVLKAIGRIGDMEALSLVEQIADDRRQSPRRRFVRQAAFDCLAKLEKRLDAEASTVGLPSGAAVTSQQPEAEVSAETAGVGAANAQVRRLIADLEEERRKSGQPGMRKAFLAASWLTIVPYTGYQLIYSAAHHHGTAALAWSACFGVATQLHRYVLSSKRTQAAQKLAAYADVQAVGLLAEMLEWPDAEMQAEAKAALARVLPKLRASDAGLLNAQQRAALYRLLRMRNAVKEQWLILAILKALQQVGDEHAVPYVKQLASSAAWLPAQKRIKAEAQECLPFLTERAQQQRASQTLLRAAGIEGDDPNILLRPATEISGADPAQLLRAGLTERSGG